MLKTDAPNLFTVGLAQQCAAISAIAELLSFLITSEAMSPNAACKTTSTDVKYVS